MSSNPLPAPTIGRPDHAARLLAEAVRRAERDGARPLPASVSEGVRAQVAADAGSREAVDPVARRRHFEALVVARAHAAPNAADLRRAIDHVRRGGRIAVAALLVVAFLTGAGAAAGALASSGDRVVNIVWTVIAVLGLQTVLLLVWLGLVVLRPRIRGLSPLLALPRFVLERASSRERGPHEHPLADAAGAVSTSLADRRIARGTASMLAHGSWTAFNIGCVVMLTVLFVGRHYDFRWETTLLSSAAGERVVRGLAAGPAAIGWPVPEDAAIERGREGGAGLSETDRQAFARLLVGLVVVYGLAPRLLLFGWAGLGRAWAMRRWRLDLDRPGYARLRSELLPTAVRRPEETEAGSAPPPAAVEPERVEVADPAAGPPVIMRVEIDPPGVWPPPLDAGVTWNDLGLVDGRVDRERVVTALAGCDVPPARVVAVLDLTATPDRGVEHFLRQVRDDGRRRLRVILSGGHELWQRGGESAVAARTQAWRTATERVGLAPDHVLELDLAHLTDYGLDRLHAMLAIDRPSSGPESHLDSAFEIIEAAVGAWRTAPSLADQAELHRAIQRRYRVSPTGLQALFRGPGAALDGAEGAESDGSGAGMRAIASADAIGARLGAGATAMLHRLPPGLRASPRWAVAGALAGACGCIAAAAVFSPVAIAALPTWAGVGAAAGAITRAARSGGGDAAVGAAATVAERGEHAVAGGGAGESEPDDATTAEAVDGAILLTLVLELQGRPEATIARVLDRTLHDLDAEPLEPGDAARCARHLDQVRDRFDTAMADLTREGGA